MTDVAILMSHIKSSKYKLFKKACHLSALYYSGLALTESTEAIWKLDFHSITSSKFPDFSLTFPWLSTVFQTLLEGQF